MNYELRHTPYNKIVVNATTNLVKCDSQGEFVTKSYNTRILFHFNLLATSQNKCFVYLFIEWATLMMASCKREYLCFCIHVRMLEGLEVRQREL